MSPWKKLLFFVGGPAVLIFAAVALKYYLVMSVMLEEHIEQSDRIINLDEFRKKSALPITDSATNIRLARYTCWIAYAEFLRFEAPVGDCIALAKQMSEDSERQNLFSDETAVQQIIHSDWSVNASKIEAPVERPTTDTPLTTDWFDVDSIKNGFEVKAQHRRETAWVDLDRGIFYFH